jgi:hypothetical protein
MNDDVSDIIPDSAISSTVQTAPPGPVDDIIPPHVTDPAVIQASAKDPSLWDKYVGFQESQLAGATGGIASLAGGLGYLGRLAITGDPDEAKAVQQDIQSGLTYAPRTALGKKMSSEMQEAAGLLGQKGGDIAGEKVADVTGSPALGAAVNVAYNIPQYLLGMKGGKEAIGEAPEPTTAAPTEQAASLEKAQKLGYVVPPATTNPSLLNRGLEGVAGKTSVAQAASIKNQAITNGLVRQELGLPEDAELTHDTLAQVRAAQSPAYQAVASIPEIQFGPAYAKELSGLTKTSDKITSALPNYKATGAEQVQQLVKSIQPENGVMDGETAVELSKSLRAEATAQLQSAARTGDPTARTLGTAYRGAATAVENAIQSHLEKIGQPELADNWDNARRTIAKTYSVESALDGAGNVDAGKLGKQLIKGKPLSGNLEAAADFANAFPKASKVGASKESMPGISPLDIATGAGAALGVGSLSHEALPTILGGVAIPAARIGSRALATSSLGQKMAVPSAPSTPGMLATPLSRLLFAKPSASDRNSNQNTQ